MLWTRRMFIKHFSLIFVVSQTTKVRYFVIYSPFFPVRCFRRSLKDLHLTSKNMVDLKCSTYPIFSKFWPWICWILFQNMHIKVLITHPAPLILIHCNSANTHGRGYWRWLDHGRCRGFVVHPAFSEFPLTRTPRSEMRFHCPRLYSFLSCKGLLCRSQDCWCVLPPKPGARSEFLRHQLLCSHLAGLALCWRSEEGRHG